MANVNIYDMADTWNDAGTTFTAIKMTVTDTSSASGSLLLDLQHGASGSEASVFNIATSGQINYPAGSRIGEFSNTLFIDGKNAVNIAQNGGWGAHYTDSRLNFLSGTALAWSSGTADSSTTSDLYLTRKGERNLQLGPADAAALQNNAGQTLSVQSIANGTTADAVGGDFTIQGSAGTGSGAGGSIIFQVAPAGTSGTGQNTLVDALTIGSDKSATFAGNLSVSAGAGLANFSVTGSGYNTTIGDTTNYIVLRAASANSSFFFNGSGANGPGLTVAAGLNIAFASGTNAVNAQDTILTRDAANTLALRNGANAQTFNIYNTFTDATNHERFSIIAQSGGAVQIGTNKGSVGGAARALELQTDGQTRLTITTSGVVNIGNNPFKVLGSFAVTSGYNSVLWSDGILGWGSGVVSETTTPDTCLQRDGAPDKLALKRGANAQEFRVYKNTTGTVYKALLGDNNLIKISGEAFTDGAGASTGALTNAPAAGNPTKWIPIDDNGTTRYIPAW